MILILNFSTDVFFFQDLKSIGLDLSHDAADLPINRPKNRYTNILPCESALTCIYLDLNI